MIRIVVIGAICLICTSAMATFSYFWKVKAVELADIWLLDRVIQFGKSTPENEDLVLLGIDDATLALQQDWIEEGEHDAITMMRTPYPYDREVWAMAIERLLESGAKLVVIDLLFLGPSQSDPSFAAVLEKYKDRVILGYNLTQESAEGRARTLVTAINYPSDTLIPQSFEPDSRVGFVTLWPDADGRVRRAFLATTVPELNSPEYRAPEGEPIHYSIAGRALKTLGRTDLLDDREEKYIKFADMSDVSSGRTPYAPRSFYGIFHPPYWKSNFDSGKAFKDKIVFIGPVAASFQDRHDTAVGDMLGVHIHMNVLAASMADEFYTKSESSTVLLLVLLAGVVAFVIVAFLRKPVLKLLILFGVVALYFLVVLLVYNLGDLAIPVAPPVIVCLTAGIFAYGADFAIERKNELRLRRTLVRYTSAELVSEIMANRDDFEGALSGMEKEMTILFSDIRKFTSLTEDLEPSALVTQLNEYLGEMVQSVFAYRGTVDKFIGDAVMAVWGSVRSEGATLDAKHAVSSALEMCRRLDRLNDKWVSEGRPPFEVGIGINLGAAIFGNIGSDERSDPTVIGDAVNLASRVEGLTKYYRCAIIVSDSVKEKVDDEFVLRRVDKVRVENRYEPAEVFSVLGRSVGGQVEPMPEQWEQALEAYWSMRFEEAEKILLECLKQHPDDYLSRLFLDRARGFIKEHPGEGWDGVAVVGK